MFFAEKICCNQMGQLKQNPVAISGFVCIKDAPNLFVDAFCWSTDDWFCPPCRSHMFQGEAVATPEKNLSGTVRIQN